MVTWRGARRMAAGLVGFSVVARLGAVVAWGEAGHRIVGALADKNVSAATRDQFQPLLGAASLAAVANWADQVKYEHEWRWTESLHYADTAEWKCSFSTNRDCPSAGNCVVGAIANYTRLLQQPPSTSNNHTVALMFLVHFVGDIAQPLHVGFASDRGGNEVHGRFCGRSTNLHEIWDERVIERRMRRDFQGSESDYIDYLSAGRPPAGGGGGGGGVPLCRLDGMLSRCLQEWGSDSASLACKYAYVDAESHPFESGFVVCDDYYRRSVEIIERQLIAAGLRLASLLDQIFRDHQRVSIAVA